MANLEKDPRHLNLLLKRIYFDLDFCEFLLEDYRYKYVYNKRYREYKKKYEKIIKELKICCKTNAWLTSIKLEINYFKDRLLMEQSNKIKIS